MPELHGVERDVLVEGALEGGVGLVGLEGEARVGALGLRGRTGQDRRSPAAA